MKLLFQILILLFLISYNTKAESTVTVDHKNETSSTYTNFHKSYSGKMGKNLEVVFDITNINGQVSGYYYYLKKGIDIELIGEIKEDSLILYELNWDKNKTALIKGKLNQKNISGRWINLLGKKEYIVNLIETDKAIPKIPLNICGTYKNSDGTACDLNLIISKERNEFLYEIKIYSRNIKGKISFSRDLNEPTIDILFEGIEWSGYEGELDENGEPRERNLKLPVGIWAELDGNKISFQNYGNAMNSYIKLDGCGDKFITLEK